MTPNKPRIQLWVDALRSGDHIQTTGRLARMNGRVEERCCLGVACVVAGAPRDAGDRAGIRYDGDPYSLPPSVREWFGFDQHNPALIDKEGGKSYAAELNDGAGYTFDDLADAIERTYLS